MFKKTICVLAAVIGLASCDKTGKVETTPTGLKYIFYKRDEKGRKAKPGEIITMNFAFKTAKDSVLRSTFKEQGPIQVPLQPSPFKGSLEEGLALVSPGDSVAFFIKADSLFAKSFNQPLPPFIAKGSEVTFLIKVDKIQSQDELKKDRETDAVKQKDVDAKKISEYATKNNLANVQKTPSGLNYIINEPGTGKQAARGDSVSVHYVLKTLDGKVLESSHENPRNNNQPFTFPLGMGMVIPGWDEGITLFKKGGKGTLIVPSGLAYGPDSRPGMPGNSILIFDIELVDVK